MLLNKIEIIEYNKSISTHFERRQKAFINIVECNNKTASLWREDNEIMGWNSKWCKKSTGDHINILILMHCVKLYTF